MHDFRAKMRDFAPNPGPICVDVPISAQRVFQENVLPKLGHPTECTLVPFFKLRLKSDVISKKNMKNKKIESF